MLRKAGRAALGLFYPARCAGCARFDTVLCPSCAQRLEHADGPGRCGNCAARWDGPDSCPRCPGLGELAGVTAAVEFEGAAKRLVHALKYQRNRAVVPVMAGYLDSAASGRQVDGWVAVPLHGSRERRRGFNQAELLLRAASLHPAPGRLRRIRDTAPQVGQHFTGRQSNVAGAFAYEGPTLAGLKVGIIDDVITTGATVNECARTLRESGAREVWALSFARASYTASPGRPIDA